MIPAVLLAACLFPPLFAMDGPTCTPDRQEVECGCSECMAWEPGDETAYPAASYFEIQREFLARGETLLVGDTRWRNRAAFNGDDGTAYPAMRALLWCYAWDQPMADEGELYEYSVRGCTEVICASWDGAPKVRYRGTRYECWIDGVPVDCYAAEETVR